MEIALERRTVWGTYCFCNDNHKANFVSWVFCGQHFCHAKQNLSFSVALCAASFFPLDERTFSMGLSDTLELSKDVIEQESRLETLILFVLLSERMLIFIGPYKYEDLAHLR